MGGHGSHLDSRGIAVVTVNLVIYKYLSEISEPHCLLAYRYRFHMRCSYTLQGLDLNQIGSAINFIFFICHMGGNGFF